MIASEPLLCGVDLGTASVRAIVFALDGRVVATGARRTPFETLAPGAAELDADALWAATAAAIADAVGALDAPHRVRAIAVASFAESGAALDRRGRPVAPMQAWYDQRPGEQTERLRRRHGALELGLRSGMRLDPVPGLAKILWLRDRDPDAFSRLAHWLNAADFIAWHLCGEMATDPSLAGRTLAYELAEERWNADLLAAHEIPLALLPRLAANAEPLATVRASVASTIGLSEDCLVVVGGHDHVLGALAAGAMQRDVALDSIGTAEAYLRTIERPIADPRVVEWGFEQGLLRIGAGGPALRFVVGGLVTASAAVEWFRRDVASGASHEELIDAARETPPGAHGAVFVPHLRLGSPPDANSRTAGAFLGLTAETDRGALFRALLEGLACDLRKVAEHSAQLTATVDTPAPRRLRVIGGGTRNELLLAIKAAVYDKPLEVLSMPESTSLGAALLAGVGAGVYADIDAAIAAAAPSARIVSPDPALAEHYETLYQTRYLPAVDALRALRAG